ncbi:DUF2946 family protein [Sphingobium sp. TCM1]|uniref:DUF2946 family protein n=1 Tax=Sphingobium sp. TCM1 TaxID=453246 RepID=UPI002FC2C37D
MVRSAAVRSRGASSRNGRGLLFAALAFLALAIKIIVPPGFMATTDASGGTRIVMCTGYGAVTKILTIDGHVKDLPAEDGRPKHDSVCPYSGHAAASTLAQAYPVEWPPAGVDTDKHTPAALGLTPGRGMAAPPPPSRGPPVSQL